MAQRQTLHQMVDRAAPAVAQEQPELEVLAILRPQRPRRAIQAATARERPAQVLEMAVVVELAQSVAMEQTPLVAMVAQELPQQFLAAV